MKIDYLLEQYFEGRTTSEEEAMLRHFFISDDIPEYLMIYKPLFTHFDNEIKQMQTCGVMQAVPATPQNRKTFVLWISGVAACAAIFFGFFFSLQQKQCPGNGDYVMIDGRCYTDAATIRSATFKTLHEIAKDDDFFPANRTSNVIDLVENQLKEFNFLLDE